MTFRGIASCLVAAAALAAAAGASAEDQPERVYRWTDASGEENFTNNILKVPEPYRSRYLAEENAEKEKAKAKASREKAREDVKRAVDALKTQQAGPQDGGAQTEGAITIRPSASQDAALKRGAAKKTKEGAPKGKPGPMDFEPAARTPFQDYQPQDTRNEDTAAEANREEQKKAKGDLERLQALLKKKIEEMNLAAGWEMILHTPKYTQDKLRLMDEIETIKKQVKDNEKKLEDISKQRPTDN
jgi:hypothetical protein